MILLIIFQKLLNFKINLILLILLIGIRFLLCLLKYHRLNCFLLGLAHISLTFFHLTFIFMMKIFDQTCYYSNNSRLRQAFDFFQVKYSKI